MVSEALESSSSNIIIDYHRGGSTGKGSTLISLAHLAQCTRDFHLLYTVFIIRRSNCLALTGESSGRIRVYTTLAMIDLSQGARNVMVGYERATISLIIVRLFFVFSLETSAEDVGRRRKITRWFIPCCLLSSS